MGGGFGVLLGERRGRGGRIDEGDEGWLGADAATRYRHD